MILGWVVVLLLVIVAAACAGALWERMRAVALPPRVWVSIEAPAREGGWMKLYAMDAEEAALLQTFYGRPLLIGGHRITFERIER